MKRKIKTRNRLEKRIEQAADITSRRHLARYGKVMAQAQMLEWWWPRLSKAATPQPELALPSDERNALVGTLVGYFTLLNDEFFDGLAEAIRDYRRTLKPGSYSNKLRADLHSADIWDADPPLNVTQIASKIGYVGNIETLRRIVTRLQIPHAKRQPGRPKQSPTHKRKTHA